jgi:hypothetical protein
LKISLMTYYLKADFIKLMKLT